MFLYNVNMLLKELPEFFFFFFLNLNISYIPHSNCCLSPIYQYMNTKSITW